MEIQGEERNVLAVASEGTRPIDLEFAPSVYTPKTAAIYISWGPMPVFAEIAPAPGEPAFVSPTEVPRSAAEPADATSSASEIIPPAQAPPDSAFAAARLLMALAGELHGQEPPLASRSSRRLSEPPQTHPVSSASRSVPAFEPERRPVSADDAHARAACRPGTSNQG